MHTQSSIQYLRGVKSVYVYLHDLLSILNTVALESTCKCLKVHACIYIIIMCVRVILTYRVYRL